MLTQNDDSETLARQPIVERAKARARGVSTLCAMFFSRSASPYAFANSG
jgi:hypothetical protein